MDSEDELNKNKPATPGLNHQGNAGNSPKKSPQRTNQQSVRNHSTHSAVRSSGLAAQAKPGQSSPSMLGQAH